MNRLAKQIILLIIALGILLSMSACGGKTVTADNKTGSDLPSETDNGSEDSLPEEEKAAYYATEFDVFDADGNKAGTMKRWYNTDGEMCLVISYGIDGETKNIQRYTYEYSSAGKVSKRTMGVKNGTGGDEQQIVYEYDDAGNIVSVGYVIGDSSEEAPAIEINGSYGRLSSDFKRTFDYDKDNRVLGYTDVLKSSGEEVGHCELSYSSDYRTASYELIEEGGETAYTGEIEFDEENRVISYKHISPEGVETDSWECEYDEAGRVLRYDSMQNGGTDTVVHTEQIYTYDGDGKPLEEKTTSSFGDAEPTISRSVATAWVTEDQLPEHYAGMPDVA